MEPDISASLLAVISHPHARDRPARCRRRPPGTFPPRARRLLLLSAHTAFSTSPRCGGGRFLLLSRHEGGRLARKLIALKV